MDRTDPLDAGPDLDPRHRRPRHGHAPALWLALPLWTGCWLHAALGAGAAAAACLGLGLALLAGRTSRRRGRIALALAGVAIGAGWHGALAAERTAWRGDPGPDDLFLRIERVESAEDRWWALGSVEGGPPGTLRRRAWAKGEGDPPRRGALAVVSGMLRADPGDSGWRRSQGVTLLLARATARAELEPPGATELWREAAARRLEAGLAELAWGTERGASLLAATLLGRSRLLEPADREAFAATGTLHLFAISGLHIAGMAALLALAARALRIPWRAAAVGALVLLALYVEATGGTPSARRAWIMSAGLLACRCLERRANPAQGLGLAAAATLVVDPEAATDAGFQLSYLSVGGILLAGAAAARALAEPTAAERLTAPGAAGAIRRAGWWLRARLAEGLAVATAASVAGAPLATALFGQAAPAGVLANLVLVPLSTPPLALGMLSVALGPFGALDPLRRTANALAAAWLEGMAGIAGAAARWPGMGVELAWRSDAAAAACQAGLVALLLARAEARGAAALLLPPVAWTAAWLLVAAG